MNLLRYASSQPCPPFCAAKYDQLPTRMQFDFARTPAAVPLGRRGPAALHRLGPGLVPGDVMPAICTAPNPSDRTKSVELAQGYVRARRLSPTSPVATSADPSTLSPVKHHSQSDPSQHGTPLVSAVPDKVLHGRIIRPFCGEFPVRYRIFPATT